MTLIGYVTSNVNNLSSPSCYEGPDEIIIGNGIGLHITHVGFIPFPSPSSSSFSLFDVLCIPSIWKDLIFISKFNEQNKTSIELFPDFFPCEGSEHGGESSLKPE